MRERGVKLHPAHKIEQSRQIFFNHLAWRRRFCATLEARIEGLVVRRADRARRWCDQVDQVVAHRVRDALARVLEPKVAIALVGKEDRLTQVAPYITKRNRDHVHGSSCRQNFNALSPLLRLQKRCRIVA